MRCKSFFFCCCTQHFSKSYRFSFMCLTRTIDYTSKYNNPKNRGNNIIESECIDFDSSQKRITHYKEHKKQEAMQNKCNFCMTFYKRMVKFWIFTNEKCKWSKYKSIACYCISPNFFWYFCIHSEGLYILNSITYFYIAIKDYDFSILKYVFW